MNTWKNWRQSSQNPNVLIHHSGKDELEYEVSGSYDVANLLETIPAIADKKTLDYGCGNGRMIRHMSCYNVWGVDVVPEFIVTAQKYSDKCFLLDHLPETNFDIVYALSVFIHLNDEDTTTALKYIYNKLTPGGRAYLQIPVYDYHTQPLDFIDVRTWSSQRLLPLVEDIGFKTVELHTNVGKFAYDNVGPNHHKYQVFEKWIKS